MNDIRETLDRIESEEEERDSRPAQQQLVEAHLNKLVSEANENIRRGDIMPTLEFSASARNIDPESIWQANRRLLKGHWVRVSLCETCYEHDPETPYHIEIMKP